MPPPCGALPVEPTTPPTTPPSVPVSGPSSYSGSGGSFGSGGFSSWGTSFGCTIAIGFGRGGFGVSVFGLGGVLRRGAGGGGGGGGGDEAGFTNFTSTTGPAATSAAI